jgi:hypothetical protein
MDWPESVECVVALTAWGRMLLRFYRGTSLPSSPLAYPRETNAPHYRIDVAGNIVSDSAPQLPLPIELRSPARPFDASPRLQQLLAQVEQVGPEFMALSQIMRNLSSAVSIMHTRISDATLSPDDMLTVSILIPPMHALLSLPRQPPGSSESTNWHDRYLYSVQEILRLACLILLSVLKANLFLGSAEMPILQEKLNSILNKPDETIGSGSPYHKELTELQLWGVVVAAVIRSPQSQSPLVKHIRRLASILGLESAREVIDNCKQIIWIESIPSEDVERLIHQVDQAK